MPPTAPQPRVFGTVNGRGVWTLMVRDLRRFWKDAWGSLGGPAVSGLLLLAVFVLALGGQGEAAGGITFAQFVVPGIASFALIHGAYAYGAVPIIHDKHEGTIADVLSAPLTAFETAAGYMLSATLNGVATGLFVLGLLSLFVAPASLDPLALLAFAAAGSLLFALTGELVGLWADRWDHYSAAESFLILPLGVLSGAFFPLDGLPEAARQLILFNPVFHLVDGVRFALTGQAAWLPGASLAILLIVDLLLALVIWRLFSVGYKIKA
jgi:ABC-2 type transport system permease protein